MDTVALDLNDAALALVAGGTLRMQEPGYALALNGRVLFGAEAAAQARLQPLGFSSRHWRELSSAPLARPLPGVRSGADLVRTHLLRLCAALPVPDTPLVFAVPAYWSESQLGLLLGIAADAGLRVTGLVDAAVAASRRAWPGGELWHLELSLHGAALTGIRQGDAAAIARREFIEGVSRLALDRACARAIAQAFLRSSRFDPFHDAESEQALFDRLDGWLAALRGQSAIEATLAYRGNEFHVRAQAVELHAAVAQVLEPLVQKLRAVVPAGESLVLQVPERLADYPGALELFARLPGAHIVLMEPGAAASGALRASRLPVVGGSAAMAGIGLIARLPFDRDDRAPAALTPTASTAAIVLPTHLVHEGRAWRLSGEPLRIGTEPQAGEFALKLPASMPGLSRRHCSLHVEDGRVLLHDHSRWGTRLNGHRIESVAILHAGDCLEIGDPPIRLQLVAEMVHGATA